MPADESVGISEMAVIFMSLCAVDCATGWDMEDEELMEEVERRVCDEEPVLLVGSPIERGQAQEPRGAMRQRT